MTSANATPPSGPVVHVVDDDPAIRDSLGFLLQSRGITTCGWPSGEAFLEGVPDGAGSCVVLDVRMEGISGLEVLECLNAAGRTEPVVFLTGHADVPIAVEALKKGAFDFVEKPFNDNALVDTVLAALARAAADQAASADRGQVETRLQALTSRERDVLLLLMEGRLNKQIADSLGISMRTVEVHRARILEKMGVRNAVELAALVGPLITRPPGA